MEIYMKVINSIFLCLFLTFSFVNAFAQDAPPRPVNDYFPENWKTHNSTVGGFSIKFPGTPWELRKDLDTKYGKVVQNIVEYGRESFIRYSVSYREFPKSLNELERRIVIDDERDSLLKSLARKTVLINDTETKTFGLPSRLFTIELDDAKFLRVLYVIKDKKHYVISVESFSRHESNRMGAENGYEKIALSFLNSFQFIDTVIDNSNVKTVAGVPIAPSIPPTIREKSFDEKSWKEFSDDEKGFSVLAIGLLNKNISNQNVKGLPATTHTYKWETSVAHYTVAVTDYTVLETETEAIKVSYNLTRELFISKGWKLSSEKDVYIDKYLGREFIFDVSDVLRLKTRVFYIGSRLFQIIFAAPPDKKGTKSTSDFFEQTSEKFLDSFKLSKSSLTKAEEQIAESKSPNNFDNADFRGKIENSIYTNDFMGFTFKIPEKWFVKSDDEVIFLQEKGMELMSKGNETSKKLESVAKKNVRNLISIAKGQFGSHDNTNLSIAVERLPIKSMISEVYISLTKQTIKEALNNIDSISETSFRKIGTKEFAVFDAVIKIEQKKATIRYLAFCNKGMALVMVFSFSNEKELEFLEQIINSFSFKQ